MIVVVDYEMGNAGSILNMLAKIGAPAVLTRDPRQIRSAEKLILPGIGAFDEGMDKLESLGLVPVLTDRVLRDGTPILGICLGMQLFAGGSEEGSRKGLSWIDGTCERFSTDPSDRGLRVPHMGWNRLRLRKSSAVFRDLEDDARFYFVHSYHLRCRDDDDVLATTSYGVEFVSALSRDRIVGVQFHPEKSLRWGIGLFRRFVSGA
jgi:glutamine amidotransferase